MKSYKALWASMLHRPLCIHPPKLHEIAALLESRQAGEDTEPIDRQPDPVQCFSPGGEQLALDAVPTGGNNAFVAVLPLFGTMFQHGGMSMRASGGVSTEQFGRDFSRLAENPSIKTIILSTHSPGGQVWGTQELSDLIYGARGQGTRIVAAVNSMAASAALWTATAADRVYVTPGGEMGSVGVVVMHEDVSQAEENAGIKTTLIAEPEAKVAGHPFGPLSDDEAERIRGEISKTYKTFTGALARNRGVSRETVVSDFGGGRMLDAKDAVKAGMADDVRTFRDVLAKEVSRLRPRGGSKARNSRALAIAEQEQLDLETA